MDVLREPTCQAVDELLLSVLVEQVRAEDQLQTLVTGLSSTGRQHLIQQCHLLVADAADAGQSVLDKSQDLPEDTNQPLRVLRGPLLRGRSGPPHMVLVMRRQRGWSRVVGVVVKVEVRSSVGIWTAPG